MKTDKWGIAADADYRILQMADYWTKEKKWLSCPPRVN